MLRHSPRRLVQCGTAGRFRAPPRPTHGPLFAANPRCRSLWPGRPGTAIAGALLTERLRPGTGRICPRALLQAPCHTPSPPSTLDVPRLSSDFVERFPLFSSNRPTLCGWSLRVPRLLPRAGNFVSTANSTWQSRPDRCADRWAENSRNPVALGERRPSWLPAAVPTKAGCVPEGTARRFRCDNGAKRKREGWPYILCSRG